MHNIIFKAKTLQGEWVEGYYLSIGYKTYIICEAETECMDGENTDLYATEWYEVDSSTICQYTGLKDKNGKLIWENDIALRTSSQRIFKGKMVYDNNASFCHEEFETRFQALAIHSESCIEVIGNIFDNPELLEGGAE